MPEVLCRAPLTVLVRGGLSEEECVALLTLAKRSVSAGVEGDINAPGAKRRATLEDPKDEIERLALAALDATLEAVVDTKLSRWSAHSTAPDVEGEPDDGLRKLPLGLHVDTLHAPRRFVTALLYLTTLDESGGTYFPLALPMNPGGRKPWLCVADERARRSSQRLLDLGIEHTQEVSRVFPRRDAVAIALDALEEHSRNPSSGLTVAPVAGDMVVFFTRGDDARVDARAWHGGVSVTRGHKWTLQNFMELPGDVLHDEEAAYIVSRRQHVIQCAAA